MDKGTYDDGKKRETVRLWELALDHHKMHEGCQR